MKKCEREGKYHELGNGIRLFLAVFVGMLISLRIVNTVVFAESIMIEINGVMYYYRDGEEITEEDYWQEKMTENFLWYSEVGKIMTKSDGTELWYGANKLYYSELEAVEGYMVTNQETDDYKMSDGTYLYFCEGQKVESKEEYLKKVAELYKAQDIEASDILKDGTEVYFYDGNVYYEERAFYEAQGYKYAATESEAKAYIDLWYDKNSTEVEFNLIYKGEAAVRLQEYFESKELPADAVVCTTYREFIAKGQYGICNAFMDTDLHIGMTMREEETNIKEAKNVAKRIADSLKGKSTYEQIKGAYEWLCNNVEYDYSLENHSAYDALVRKKAVCEGYTSGFQLIMEELGIESYIVADYWRLHHGWNAVRLDGKLYWIDATWGDQVSYIDYNWLLCGTDTRAFDEWDDVRLDISTKSYKNGNGNTTSTTQQTTVKPTTTQQTKPTTSQRETQETTEEETTTVETTQEATMQTTTVQKETIEEETVVEQTTTVKQDKVTEEMTTLYQNDETSSVDNKVDRENGVVWAILIVATVFVVGGAVVYAVIYMKKKKSSF